MSAGASASPAPGAPEIPAIDRSVLAEWLADDDAAIDALLAVFRDSICAEQLRMRETLALDDLDGYASAAHRMRGAALSMGARALADAAGTLYDAARAQNGAACGTGLPILETQIRLMKAEIPLAVATLDGPSPGT